MMPTFSKKPRLDGLANSLNQSCQLCQINKPIANLPFCRACFTDIPLTHERFIKANVDKNHTSIMAVSHYDFPIADCILDYKYQHNMSMLPVLTSLFCTLPLPDKNTLLVPMPSSSLRLKERGFDHIFLLTKSLARMWQLPVWHGVKRVGKQQAQKQLSREQRLNNLEKAFQLSKLPPTGKKLLIIDDVCTTGSTIAALAHCLDDTKLRTSAYVLAHKLS